MSTEPLSTALDEDAGQAYHRLRHEARTLASISSSFNAAATRTSAAFLAALTASAPDAWRALVGSAASLVHMARALDGIVAFDASEREAVDFFTAIVVENADLS
jgi:hypothetical protein